MDKIPNSNKRVPKSEIKYKITLSEEQKEAKSLIYNSKVSVLYGPAGSSKTLTGVATALDMFFKREVDKIIISRPIVALEQYGILPGPQPLTSSVSTSYGFKQLKDININDLVQTPSGEIVEVTNIIDYKQQPVYKITTKQGKVCYAAETHLWTVHNQSKGGRVETLTTKELLDTNLQYNIKEKKVYKYYLPKVKEVCYNNFDEPILNSYLLGILLGDGSLTDNHVRFTTKDEEIVNKISEIVKPYSCIIKSKGIQHTISSLTKDTWRGCKEVKITNLETNEILFFNKASLAAKHLNIPHTTLLGRIKNKSKIDNLFIEFTNNTYGSCNKVLDKCEKLGIYNKRFNEKRIPKDYFKVSINDRYELLRGLLDSDGTCKKSGETIFYSSNYELAKDVQQLVWSLGGAATIQNGRNRSNVKIKGVKIENPATSYAVNIVTEQNPFFLSRKRERYNINRKANFDYIVNIEYTGKEDVRCITINHKDSLYLTDDFIPTHNSLEEKIAPFLAPIMDNLYKLYDKEKIDKMVKEGYIQILPVAYVQGITVDDILIVDECLEGSQKIRIQLESGKTILTNMKTLVKHYSKNNNVKVLSYNHEKDILEYKKILNIQLRKTNKWIKIYDSLRADPLICTENHPVCILTDDGKIVYKQAKDLQLYDNFIKTTRPNKTNHNILNVNNLDIIAGFLLGDGFLCKNKSITKCYTFGKNHGLQQEQYMNFCKSSFKDSRFTKPKSGFTGLPLCGFTTKSYNIPKDFINSLYSNNKKVINSTINNYITKRSLALWYMDDGNLGGSNNITLHTQGFVKSNVEVLVKMLKSNFDIDATISTVTKKGPTKMAYYYIIRMDKENSEKYLTLIKGLVHPNLKYKIPIEFWEEFDETLYKIHNDIYSVHTGYITKIETINLTEPELTYNMEVEDNNNFFTNGILTHNCENLTVFQTRQILSRLGKGGRIILTGDVDQVALKDITKSGFKKLLDLESKNINGLSFKEMKVNYRDEFVQEILKHY